MLVKFPADPKAKRRVLITVGLGSIIAIAVGIWEYQGSQQPITSLERRAVGESEYQETLTVRKEDGEEFEIVIPIPEQQYTRSEVMEMFQEIREQLPAKILGDNQSFDKIETDMFLPGQFNDGPARIIWRSSRPTVLDWEGRIGEQVDEDGEVVQLTAEINYQDEVVEESWEVKVFPRRIEDVEAQRQRLLAAAESENVDKNTKTFALPAEVDGEKISWFSLKSSNSAVVIALTFIMAVVILLGSKQEEIRDKQVRETQMQIDYPDILSKLILLMNAGMSMRRAFARVALDYKKQKEIFKRKKYYRYAYEEILVTYQEMERGVMEVEAYERMGVRCGLPMYKVFAVLLIQNLKKGNQRLLEAMEQEMVNAFEERKRRAKVLGEQAGTKLLLPMMIMLLIVFVLLLIPAFLSF